MNDPSWGWKSCCSKPVSTAGFNPQEPIRPGDSKKKKSPHNIFPQLDMVRTSPLHGICGDGEENHLCRETTLHLSTSPQARKWEFLTFQFEMFLDASQVDCRWTEQRWGRNFAWPRNGDWRTNFHLIYHPKFKKLHVTCLHPPIQGVIIGSWFYVFLSSYFVGHFLM